VTLLGGNDALNHVSSLAELSDLLFHGCVAAGGSSSASVTAEHSLLLLLIVVNPSRDEGAVSSLESRVLAALISRLAECAADSTTGLRAEASYATVDVGNGDTAEESHGNSDNAKNHDDGVVRGRWWVVVTLLFLSTETIVRTILGLVMMRPVRLVAVMRGRRVAMVRITRARRTGRMRRVTSGERERKMTVVRRWWGRGMVRRAMMRRMRTRVGPISVVRTVMRAMVRGMRRSKDGIVESVRRVSHLICHGVQNTLNAITLLDLLQG
jgi:hypothetical protein